MDRVAGREWFIEDLSGLVTFIAGILSVLLSLTPITTIRLLVVISLLLLAPVLYGILVWIKVFDARELET